MIQTLPLFLLGDGVNLPIRRALVNLVINVVTAIVIVFVLHDDAAPVKEEFRVIAVMPLFVLAEHLAVYGGSVGAEVFFRLLVCNLGHIHSSV